MVHVGITGGIGSGKTLVCSVLEMLGVPVFYADREAKRVMNSDPVLRKGIIGLLGKEAYMNGELDTGYVSRRVFGDRDLLQQLNSLVHPVVRAEYRSWADGWTGLPYVVEEAAILFESGANRYLDITVLIYAPVELRISRVIQRDGVDRGEVLRRMSSQMDEEEKRVLADEVIINDEKEMLLPQIIVLHEKIIKR